MNTQKISAIVIGILIPFIATRAATPARLALKDTVENGSSGVTWLPGDEPLLAIETPISTPEPPPMDPAPTPAEEPATTQASPAPGPIIATTPVPTIEALPAAQPAPAATPAPTPSPAPVKEIMPLAKDGIRMNFQGAPLSEVLNYLSEAAGFIIVQETPVTGTVNIVSKQAVTADEAVDLVNAVISEKGFVAMRNNRILTIVPRRDAQKRELPVIRGSDPALIPRKADMVTQILPLRYVEAAKLIENLRPFLSAEATISSNDNSNAILLTDTQINIRRIAQIIHELDTSISSIATIHVFPLRFADAKELASVITQLFASDQSGARGGQNAQQAGGPPFFGGFGGFGGRGGGGAGGGRNAAPQSEARTAASRVIAVSDTQSNSVIVSAPDEYMATISEVVSRLDTSITDITETRIFHLEHADATELATTLNALYGDNETANQAARARGAQGQQQGGRQGQAQNQQSERALLQAKMVAVADPRTNSVLVSASREMMSTIALTVGRLDASNAKKQQVWIHKLDNIDPESVADILRGMFSDQASTTSSTQPGNSRLTQRQTSGAAMDANSILSNTSGGGATRGGGR